MAGLVFFHHRPQLQRSAEATTLVIPVGYHGYIPVLLGFWICVWGALEAALTWWVIGVYRHATPSPLQPPEILMLFLLGFTAAGGFLLWRFLWVLRGREILEITPRHLTLRRRPAGGPREKFERSEIRDLRVGSLRGKVLYPSWGRRFVGKGDSYVTFRYRDEDHEFGRGMEVGDAETVVDLLRRPA